jgi:hypothetical protein
MSINDPKMNVKKHDKNCRCVMLETTSSNNELLVLIFTDIDAARAYHGMLGYALGLEI